MHAQNSTLMLNSNILPVEPGATLRIVPKVPHAPVLQLLGCEVLGFAKFARLARLKQSARKISPRYSVRRKRLCKEASICASPGPCLRFRAAFPKNPTAGLSKAVTSKYPFSMAAFEA